MAPRVCQKHKGSNKSCRDNNTDDIDKEATAETSQGACPLTSKETNAMLITAVKCNPWGKEHGNIGNTWDEVANVVGNSMSVTWKFTTAVIKKKVNKCIDLHKGHKPQTQFSNSETGIYHSQIDLICGLKETAERKKEQGVVEKSNQAACIGNPSSPPASLPIDPDVGLDHTTCSNKTTPSSPRCSQQLDLVIEALENVTKAENTQHGILIAAIENNSECFMELAQGMQVVAQAQVESNQLTQELTSQNWPAATTSKHACDSATIPEEAP
ncbi:hypothetical protein RhiTH_001521 [Rhizoctonia solani]